MKIKCPKCNHEWETKSQLKMVTCPSCQLKVKLDKKENYLNNKNDKGGIENGKM